MQALSLGFSPCPNDTFIFDSLVHQQVADCDLTFEVFLEDVETLNQWAFEGKLDITKLSYSAFLQLTDTYQLLDSGSALGFGVGPLLVTTKEKAASISDIQTFLQTARIAIPGKYTTANLLLSLAFPQAKNKKEVLFSNIEAAVLSGEFDAGLIIHENRFTYAERGLEKLMDCGAWWESETNAAIPLGGIVIKKSLPQSVKQKVQKAIKNSLELSWQAYPTLSNFITHHAQEMSEDVMRKHINLYVNEYSKSLAKTGRNAIDTLFNRAYTAGIIAEIPKDYMIE